MKYILIVDYIFMQWWVGASKGHGLHGAFGVGDLEHIPMPVAIEQVILFI